MTNGRAHLLREQRPRRSVMALVVVLAFPTGAQLRDHLDTRSPGYPVHTVAVSDLVDGDPAERELDRYVLTTATPAHRIARRRGIVEAVDLGGGHVAVATRLTRREVAAWDSVTRVEVDALRSITSSDPAFSQLWGLHNTGQPVNGTAGLAGADIRWNDLRGHTDGSGAVVAVIDSGIDFSHPDLAHALWTNPDEVCDNGVDDDANGFTDDCHGWDFVNNDKQQLDRVRADGAAVDNSHGTHIAGTIAAAADNGVGVAGVAPGVKIMPIKVVENGSFPMSRTALAINYAVANGADVINASWGGSGMGTAERNAVHTAGAEGVLIAAAAGNSGTDNDVTPQYPASLDAPAILAVAASTSTDQSAWFSCYGATSVDLHAPGHMILSTAVGGGLVYMSGTSMAAPHVAAVAALLRSRTPDLALTDVRGAILSGVDKLAALAGKTVTGGRLDAASTLGIAEGGIRATFNGFDRFPAGAEHTGHVVLQAPDGALPSGVSIGVRASLGVVDAGAVRGVLHHPVNAGHTDDEAQVALTSQPLTPVDRVNMSGPGISLPVTTALPAGDYALLIELVNEDDPATAVIGQPSVVLFSIAGPEQPAPTESASPTPQPGAGQPGPAEPEPDTTSPDPDTTSPGPGSDEPGPSAPGPDTTTPVPNEPAPQPDPGHDEPAPTDGGQTAPTSPDAPRGGGRPGADKPRTRPTGRPHPKASEPGEQPVSGDPVPDDAYVPIAPPPDVPAPPPVPGSDDPSLPPAGSWRVSPDAGPTSGGQYVRIEGSFPDSAYVRFGASNGSVVHQDTQSISVQTPAHLPGTVDITIEGRDGGSTTLPAAYTFLADSPAPPATGQEPGDPGVPQPDDPQPPGTQPPPASPPPDQTPPDPIAPPDSDAPKTHRRTVGRPYTTASGLLVDAFTAGHPLTRLPASAWGDRACGLPSCSGIPL